MSLENESALRALLARSADCVWRFDVEGYAQCWSRDGEWRILGQVLQGRDAIVGLWSQLMSPFQKVWQLSHNVDFGFDGPQPIARVYLEETLVLPGGAGVNLMKGIYHDTYVEEDGAWRFARRHIDIGYLGPADFTGRWFPMIDHGPGPADPDPSRPATPSMAEAYGDAG